MQDYSLGAIEARFADIVWENAPMSTAQLVKICEKELDWKRTTTYTVLKKLSQRGLFENNNGTVNVVMSREEFYSRQSNSYVETSFGGSLPSFLAAFTAGKKLSDKAIEEIRKIIDDNR